MLLSHFWYVHILEPHFNFYPSTHTYFFDNQSKITEKKNISPEYTLNYINKERIVSSSVVYKTKQQEREREKLLTIDNNNQKT